MGSHNFDGGITMSSITEICAIPADYRDLLEGRIYASLATVMPDGQPQSTVVWCDFDGAHVLINTMRGFRKEKNMRANPKVTLLAYDQCNPLRSLEVRGMVVEMTETGALTHLDSLSVKYVGRGPYFGACVPAELSAREFPVLCRIAPTRVVTLNAGSAADNVNFSKPPRVVPTDGWLPPSHLDLVARPIQGVLTTLMPDGQPQSSLVWVDYDGECLRVNTTRQRQKGRNVQANPRVSLLMIDPDDTGRWIEVRGIVDISEEGALEHLDELTRQYTRHEHYYGGIYPVERQAQETRIICRIKPAKFTLDAIHK
jgi:PPOX class probable F420-dependent enzyme